MVKASKNKTEKIEKKEGDTKVVFPKKEKYIGSHIKSKLGEPVSNESYEKYYKDLI